MPKISSRVLPAVPAKGKPGKAPMHTKPGSASVKANPSKPTGLSTKAVKQTHLTKRAGPSAEVLAKGNAALVKFRAERAAAKDRGPKAFAEWEAEQAMKKALKKTTPMMAIRNFCLNCVDTRADIRDCTAKKCSLYIYRPYQKSLED
jgi:hypothetical protein